MNRRKKRQSPAGFLAPAFSRIVVKLDQDPIEALLRSK